jgi:hypothetical protein
MSMLLFCLVTKSRKYGIKPCIMVSQKMCGIAAEKI